MKKKFKSKEKKLKEKMATMIEKVDLNFLRKTIKDKELEIRYLRTESLSKTKEMKRLEV